MPDIIVTSPTVRLTAEQKLRRILNTPSTMSMRKAAREAAGIAARPAPQLVSLGVTEHVYQRRRNGNSQMPGDDVDVVELELFCERNDANRRYYRTVGDTRILPLFGDDGQPETSIKLGVVTARGFRSNTHQPSRPDEVRGV